MLYRIVVFSHVLGAILAVGPTMTYAMLLALGRREGPQAQAFALRAVLFVDSRLATPAFVWQLASGLVLVLGYGTARFSEAWLWVSLVLYAAISTVAMSVIAPRGKRAAAAGPGAPAFEAYTAMMRGLGPPIAVATLAIVYLMVVKPGR